MKLEIILDTEELKTLAVEGGKLGLTEEAEEKLFKLIAIRDKAEELIEEAKRIIVENGRKVSDEFRGVVGDDIKGYIKKGDRYSAKDKSIVPDWALKEVKYQKLDQGEIDSYRKEKGELPKGVEDKGEVTSFVLQYDKERAKETQILLLNS